MSVLFDSSIRLGASQPAGDTALISRSIRFNDNDSAYMYKTWSGAGDKTKFTWSAWVKRGTITTRQILLSFKQDVPLEFEADDTLRAFIFGNTALNTNRKFRDPSAWYHIVISVDSTQGTSSNRVRLYINGTQETSFSTTNYPSQDATANVYTSTLENFIGRIVGGTSYFDGYMAEINFIDGQGYDASYFGETNDNGIWVPKEYTGSYGSNGYRITGNNASSLGADDAGSNDFSVSGLAAHDQMLDTPLNNFCVMSSIDFTYNEIRNGNLETIGGNNNRGGRGTMGFNSGKFYWEMLATTVSDGYPGSGVVYDEYDADMPTAYAGGGSNHGAGASNNQANWYKQSTSGTAYGSTASSGDILQYAVDRDNNKIYWGVNGTYRNSGNPAGGSGAVASGLTHYGDWMPFVSHGSNAGTSAGTFNFGQDGTFAGAKTAQGNKDGNGIGNFYYAPPTGFLALCTSNLGAD
jgi:hypothetical protein